MTYPPYLREKARQLRREKKLTIDEIAERLAIGRTTVFHWVSDMPRPQRVLNHPPPPAELGSRAMQAKYRALREEAYREGVEMFDELNRRDGFTDFVTLFVAEGYKRTRHKVSIANSDPAVIVIANRWINEFTQRKVTYSVQYHADQNLSQLRRYWAELVGVQPSQITMQRKSNSNQLKARTWRSKYGVLTVTTGDTYFRARLQAWVDRLREGWLDSPHIGA